MAAATVATVVWAEVSRRSLAQVRRWEARAIGRCRPRGGRLRELQQHHGGEGGAAHGGAPRAALGKVRGKGEADSYKSCRERNRRGA